MPVSPAVSSSKKQTRGAFQFETRVQRAIVGLAKSDCSILIVGERGVGKRELAAQIHALSARAGSRFLELPASQCDAVGLSSALSERGTIYLDEVAGLSKDLQDCLVDHYFCNEAPTGRLLFGSKREPFENVKSGSMSDELFHLLSPITVRITPLRYRKSEILPIAEALLADYAKQFERPMPMLGAEMTEFLLDHSWPGNLKEFETAMKTFVVIGDPSISLAALKAAGPAAKVPLAVRSQSLKAATRAASIEVERRLIAEVLSVTGGNRKRAADELGISYKALLYKMKQAESEPRHSENGSGLDL